MQKTNVFMPVIVLTVSALACSSIPGLGSGDSSLYKDDFSSAGSGWSTFTSENSSVDYTNNEYVMKVFKDQWFVWGNPGETSLANVHIEVTVKNVGNTTDTSFGIMCDYASDTQHYYMGVDSQGFYAIGKVDGTSDSFLTNNDKWAQTDTITKNAPSYRLGADCANGTLTLYVDGQQIATANDSSFTTGNVGLFAWSEKETNAEIHFDDLVVTSLGK